MRTRIWRSLRSRLVAPPLAGCTTTDRDGRDRPRTRSPWPGTGSALSAAGPCDRFAFGVRSRTPIPKVAMSGRRPRPTSSSLRSRRRGSPTKDLQTGSVTARAAVPYPAAGTRSSTGYVASFDVSRQDSRARQGRRRHRRGHAGRRDERVRHQRSTSTTRTRRATTRRRTPSRTRAAAPRRWRRPRGARSAASSRWGRRRPPAGRDYRSCTTTSRSLRSPVRVPDIQPGQLTAGDSVQVTFALK